MAVLADAWVGEQRPEHLPEGRQREVFTLVPERQVDDVILEGESHWRRARVAELRGAAETVGAADLAAVAKGRQPGDGQVLLKFEDERTFTVCPVGQAAYVHFPTAGLLDVLLARLGLR